MFLSQQVFVHAIHLPIRSDDVAFQPVHDHNNLIFVELPDKTFGDWYLEAVGGNAEELHEGIRLDHAVVSAYDHVEIQQL